MSGPVITLTEAPTRVEIETAVAESRRLIQLSIDSLRRAGSAAEAVPSLRAAADALAEAGRAYLGSAPEVIAYVLPTAMGLRQLAHTRYGDHARADEILKMNPDLRRRLPLIPAGTEVTIYAE